MERAVQETTPSMTANNVSSGVSTDRIEFEGNTEYQTVMGRLVGDVVGGETPYNAQIWGKFDGQSVKPE
jgi:hypothetical protein